MNSDSAFKFPKMQSEQGSLGEIEKSILGHLILLARPRVIVELGVFRGTTTRFMLEFLELNNIPCKVVGFDAYEQVPLESLFENDWFARAVKEGRFEPVKGWLPDSLREWLTRNDEPIDVVLDDATHQYGSVSAELRLLWPRLARHGYFVADDYSSSWPGVRYAVDRFARRPGVEKVSLEASKRAWEAGHGSTLAVLRKPSHQYKTREFLPHLWLKWKIDLLGIPAINWLWGGLRPLFRPGVGAERIPAAYARKNGRRIQ